MDFKKTIDTGGLLVPHQLSLDPSGIDICGNGHVNINMHTSTIGIECDTIDISGTVKMDDTQVQRTWLESDGTWSVPDAGGGWTMLKNLPPGSSKGFNESSTDGNFIQDEGTESLATVFGRPFPIAGFAPDELLFTTILNNGDRIWWIFDYTKCANTNIGQPGWVSGYDTWSKNDSVIKSKSTNNNITYVNSPSGLHIFGNSIYLTSGGINPQPHFNTNVWNNSTSKAVRIGPNSDQYPIYRLNVAPGTVTTDYNTDFLFYQGMSIFARDSNNIPANPEPYPTLIKKEADHLHISAPLSIYPVNNELSKMGNESPLTDSLIADSFHGSVLSGAEIDGKGNWYLVRQSNTPTIVHNMDNFHFGFSGGTYTPNESLMLAGSFFSRNVANYDYDEVLLYAHDEALWQIWDRTSLEYISLAPDITKIYSGVKKSSVSLTPHPIYANSTAFENRPHIFYSTTIADYSTSPNVQWTEIAAPTGGDMGKRTYYVRRSDGQPVRLKNKVQIDVDGNLDVAGKVGIGTTTPEYKFEVVGGNKFVKLENSQSLLEFDQPHHIDMHKVGESSTAAGLFLNYYSKENVLLCSMGGNVGIGTTTPDTFLHICDKVHAEPGKNHIQIDGYGYDKGILFNYYQGQYDFPQAKISTTGLLFASDLHFSTAKRTGNDSELVKRMTINDIGNVGIGTTDPQIKLDINGNFGRFKVGYLHDVGMQGNTVVGEWAGSTSLHNFTGMSIITEASSAGANMNQTNIGFNTWRGNHSVGREVMRISGSGNVGIGVTAPGSKLHVDGVIRVDSYSSAYRDIYIGGIISQGADRAQIYSSTNLHIDAPSSGTGIYLNHYNGKDVVCGHPTIGGNVHIYKKLRITEAATTTAYSSHVLEVNGDTRIEGVLSLTNGPTFTTVASGTYGSVKIAGYRAYDNYYGIGLGDTHVLMSNGSAFGLYYGKGTGKGWLLYGNEGGSTHINHNSNIRLTTSDAGVDVIGNIGCSEVNATSSIACTSIACTSGLLVSGNTSTDYIYASGIDCDAAGWTSGLTYGPGVESGVGFRWWGTGANLSYSAKFSGWVKCHGIAWLSDERIKKNIRELNDTNALDIVNKINTYKYDYINATETNKDTLGFIAQDVFKHLPNAIQIKPGFLYNNQQLIENPTWEEVDISGETKWKLILNNELTFVESSTKKCKFYVQNDNIASTTKFAFCENDNKTFIFNEKFTNIMLVADEISDFHHIDKTQLFALYHSSIQELDRKMNRINIDTFIFLVEENEDLHNIPVNNKYNILITQKQIIETLGNNIVETSSPNGLINYTNEIFTISQINNIFKLTQSNDQFKLNYKHNLSNGYVITNGMTGQIRIDDKNIDFIITANETNIYTIMIDLKDIDYINKPITIHHINDVVPTIHQTKINLYNNINKKLYTTKFNALESKFNALESKFNEIQSKLT